MCYPSPGPRCAGHTKAEFITAREALKDAIESGDYGQYEAARKATESAREAWMRTPEGMRWLRKNGDTELADQYKTERDASIAAMKAARGAKEDRGLTVAENFGVYLPSEYMAQYEASSEEFDNEELEYASDPAYIQRAVDRIVATDNAGMKNALYGNESLTSAHVDDIIKRAPASVTSALAVRSDLSEKTLNRMAQECPQVGWAIAGNPSAGSVALDTIQRTSGDSEARRAVAAHKNASEDTIVRSAVDPSASVRAAAASNPNARANRVLSYLSNDPDESVRVTVAGNVNTLPETMKSMAKDESHLVRFAVASSSVTDTRTLRDMVENDEDGPTRAQARLNLMGRGE